MAFDQMGIDEEEFPVQGAAPAQDAPEPAADEAIPTGEIGDGTPSFENGVPTPRARPPANASEYIGNAAKRVGQGASDIGDIAADSKPDPIKRIVSYLMGEGAANPQEMAQAGAQIDPNMRPGERNLIAVEQAAKQGGPEAAWKIVQGHRVAFNAKQAFAYAALNGTQQKPPDLRAAVDAANQAQSHILDGADVQFAASPQGVTATVNDAQGQTSQINLSPDQFRRYLNVGADGQWDKLMQNGVPAALQKIATAQGGQTQISQNRPLKPNQPAQAIDTNLDAPPAQAQQQGPPQDRPGDYSPELMARAQRMFPWASQAQQAEQWMASQEQRESEMENKVTVARETGASRVDAAGVRGGSNERVQELKNVSASDVADKRLQGWQYASKMKLEAAQAKVKGEADKLAHSDANSAQTRSLRVIQEKLRTLQPLTPQEQSIIDRFNTDANSSAPTLRPQGQAPQQGAPQQAAPQQQPMGKPPVPGAKPYKGNWYTRGPNGEAVPVQQ